MSGVEVSAGTDTSARSPPRVVRVPPPKVSPLPVRMLCTVWVFVWLLIAPAPFRFAWANTLYQIGFPSLFVVAAIAETVARRKFNMRRRRWLEEYEESDRDHAGGWIASRWWFVDLPPSLDEIRKTLRSSVTDPATLVCMGAFDLPARSDLRFEPLVVGQSRISTLPQINMGALLFLLLLAVGLTASARSGIPPVIGRYWAELVAVRVVLAVLFWGFAIRPRYLRAAPGRLQLLRYGFLRRTPLIHDYPIAPGLLCVVVHGWRSVRIILSNARATDDLLLSGVSQADLTRLWQALLSTAPTPPLDPEELVG